MALVAPASLVAAPARTPLPFGLGSVIVWRTGERWESGVEFDSITCDPAGGRGGPHCDPAVVIGLPKEFNGSSGHGEAEPFVVYGHDLCSPIGGGGLDASQDRANAHLIAREEARAEQALWTGDLGNVPNFAGANGYSAPVSVGAFTDPVKALAAIEQGIAEQYGSQGVVHMSRTTATLLENSLISRGGRLYTRLETPVVAGAGYPDGAMIGSPALVGYRSEVFTASNRPGDLLDRSVNDMYAIAERSYLLMFDACPVVSATFTEEVAP